MRVAVFGTGLMGAPMAAALAKSGYEVIVYNRTPSKTEGLANMGIRIAPEPHEALTVAECVILMLSDASAITEVLLNDRTASQLRGRTVIQMGTIGPSESRQLAIQVTSHGGNYLEAPVLGSVPQVLSASLIIMVGGDRKMFERWQSLLMVFGPSPTHVGAVGQAAAVKLALNQLIGSLTAAFSLSLGMATRHGVNVEVFMSLVRASALYAVTFDRKVGRMIDRDYAHPHFPLKHLQKDIRLFIEEGGAAGLSVAGLEGLSDAIQLAMERSHSDDDYSAFNDILNPRDS